MKSAEQKTTAAACSWTTLLAGVILCLVSAAAETMATADLGEAIRLQAMREVAEAGDSYGLDGMARLPWRDNGQPMPHTLGEWKCNTFVLNVVYLAGGRVPAVAYASNMRRLVSNRMIWCGQRLNRDAARAVAESHYPYSGDLANPELFVRTMPVVNGGIEALQKGDLIILHPPPGSRQGHCMIYLGTRRGQVVHVACASDEGAVVKQFDLDGERDVTFRRPRPPPEP